MHSQKTEVCQFVLTEFGKNKNKYKELLNAKITDNELTAAHYLAVEKKEDGSEKKFLEMFFNTKKWTSLQKAKIEDLLF